MLEGKLENGFEYQISDDVLNDYELLELIMKVREDVTYIMDCCKFMLGKEQFDKLKKHCTVDGRVKSNLMVASAEEIMKNNQQLKNL